MMNIDYVLVTPARNEERFIDKTIRSVIVQTVLPKKWIIVSDGSTDRTDEIVTGFAKQYDFLTLLRVGGNEERSCGSKVKAFNAGYEQLRGVAHEFVGNLDADISFTPDYFHQIFNRFQANPRLGIAGGIIHELIGHTFVPQCISSNSVAGAVQMFRRDCWNQIGGYMQVRFGGEDAAAEITARTHNWKVQTFSELEVRHYRRVSAGEGPLFKAKLRHGISHYSLGYHPLFEMIRNAYRCFQPPYVVGAVLMSVGYLWALMTRMDRELPDNVVRHLQSEQLHRLRGMLLNGRV